MTNAPATRARTAAAAAQTLDDARDRVAALRCLAGFDVFVDRIIDVVDTRTAPGPGGYTRLRTIGAMAQRIGAAAGRSGSLELVVTREKLGGNAALVASALQSMGVQIDFIGALGAPGAVHPVCRPFADACRRVTMLAPPGETDALEFDDGKLMLGKPASLDAVTWPAILDATGGAEQLARRIGAADALALGNWTQHRAMGDVWQGLANDILPRINASQRPRTCFIDIADPAKRTDEELGAAIEQLRALHAAVPVTLGLNLSEAARLSRVAGAPGLFADDEPAPEAMRDAAAALRDALSLGCVVVHARWGAGAADDAASAAFSGPYVRRPALSTGAGDHFNAGFVLAGALGAPLDQRLAAGCACSGRYVRDAAAPTLDALIAFLRALPEPEPLHD